MLSFCLEYIIALDQTRATNEVVVSEDFREGFIRKAAELQAKLDREEALAFKLREARKSGAG